MAKTKTNRDFNDFRLIRYVHSILISTAAYLEGKVASDSMMCDIYLMSDVVFDYCFASLIMLRFLCLAGNVR